MNKALLFAASVLISSGCGNSSVNPQDVTAGGQPHFDSVPVEETNELPPTTEDTDNILITSEAQGAAELTPARLLDVLNGHMISQLDGLASLLTTPGNAADNPIAGATFISSDSTQTPVVNHFDCDAGGTLSYDQTDAASARSYTLQHCTLNDQTFNGKLTHVPDNSNSFSSFTVMQGESVVIQVEGAYGRSVSASGDATEHSWNFVFYHNPGLDLILRNSSVRETHSSADGCRVTTNNCIANRKLTAVLDLVASWSNYKPLVGAGTWSSEDTGDYTAGVIEASTADGNTKISLDADNGDPASFSSVVEVNGVATSEVIRWSDSGVNCRTSGAENIQLPFCR